MGSGAATALGVYFCCHIANTRQPGERSKDEAASPPERPALADAQHPRGRAGTRQMLPDAAEEKGARREPAAAALSQRCRPRRTPRSLSVLRLYFSRTPAAPLASPRTVPGVTALGTGGEVWWLEVWNPP